LVPWPLLCTGLTYRRRSTPQPWPQSTPRPPQSGGETGEKKLCNSSNLTCLKQWFHLPKLPVTVFGLPSLDDVTANGSNPICCRYAQGTQGKAMSLSLLQVVSPRFCGKPRLCKRASNCSVVRFTREFDNL
jgi:hypothetical protein